MDQAVRKGTRFGRISSRRFATRQGMRRVWMTAAALAWVGVTSTSAAMVVEDFESYDVGTFPAPNWSIPPNDVGSLSNPPGQTIDVQNNSNSLAGNHLQFSTTYGADAVALSLPVALSSDGEYVQVAVNIVSGRTLASIFLSGSPYAGGPFSNAPQPPVAFGLSSEPGAQAFTHQHNGVYNSEVRLAGDTPTLNTWYYLRATMRDLVGTLGVIDSYDFQVFDTEMNLIAEKLAIPFVGGEGSIGSITLRSYEQTGTSNAVVLFDQVTLGVPEPASLGLLLTGAVLVLGRRRGLAV